MVLYNAFVLSWGLTITQNSIHTISDLDRSRLSDTRSAENDRIGADTDPEYRIDASLSKMRNYSNKPLQWSSSNAFKLKMMYHRAKKLTVKVTKTCKIHFNGHN